MKKRILLSFISFLMIICFSGSAFAVNSLQPGDSPKTSISQSTSTNQPVNENTTDSHRYGGDRGGTRDANGALILIETVPVLQKKSSPKGTVVTVTPSKGAIRQGESIQLTGTIKINDVISKRTLKWSVSPSDKGVSVSKTGKVTATKKAKTRSYTITAKDANGDAKGTCTIIVTGFSISDIEIPIGGRGNITASNSLGALEWKSDNSAIASVDQSGNVEGKSIGKTTITVTATNYNYSAKCTVSVKKQIESANDFSLNCESVEIRKDKTFTIVPSYDQDKFVKPTFVYDSDNKKIATVSEKGVITGKGKGETTITVKEKNSGATRTVNVKVGVLPKKVIQVIASKTNIDHKYHNDPIYISLNFYDEHASNIMGTLDWKAKCSNAKVTLSVSPDKKSAVLTIDECSKGSSVTITVTCKENSVKGSRQISIH